MQVFKMLKCTKHKTLAHTASPVTAACFIITAFYIYYRNISLPAELLIKFTSLSVSSPKIVFTASHSGSSKQTQPYKDDINYILFEECSVIHVLLKIKRIVH
jgi:hypothetical protein